MSIFLLLGCELGFFSLLLGAYLDSLGLGFVILGICAVVMYPLFQHFNSLYPFIWLIILLGSLTTLLWATYLDYFFDTTFIAVSLSLIAGVVIYNANYFFLKNIMMYICNGEKK